MTQKPNYSNIELVARCDSWPYYQQDPAAYRAFMRDYYYFMIAGFPHPFGYVHASTVRKASWPASFWAVDDRARTLTLAAAAGATPAERTAAVEQTLRANPRVDADSAFERWTDERFPVVAAADGGGGGGGERVLDLDGAGVEAFGIVNFGCHLIAYVAAEPSPSSTASGGTEGGGEGKEWKYWVPRRAQTKATFPGMLDSTVGGSLRAGETALECMVRETQEEAGIPAEYTRGRVRACGTLSYAMAERDDGSKGCQHQVQYLFEMEMGREDPAPRPFDGEVEEFTLMGLEEVVGALRRGEFKPICALTWLAFLIRHGHVNAENELRLTEICSRLHRKHDLFIA